MNLLSGGAWEGSTVAERLERTDQSQKESQGVTLDY